MGKTFIQAMKGFFGLKEGETPMEFGREVMALSFKEREEFHRMLKAQEGFGDTEPPWGVSPKS